MSTTGAHQVFDLPRLPPRARDSHKGDHGKVVLIAGSRGMAGAAVLCARAALRSGSGLVTAAIEGELSAPVTAAVPEATQLLLPPRASSSYRDALIEALGEGLDGRFDAVAIGPGLGTCPAARHLLEATAASTAPQVIDADALNVVAHGLHVEKMHARVWTPHPGEFRRLTGRSPRTEEERIRAAGEFARCRGGTIVLKGHRSIVHDGSRYFVNVTGNAGMATGGSGDVLTGVIASLLGQGLVAFEAARLGVFLHGLAGDLAARRLGTAGLIAGDIVESLPAAFLAHR